MNPEDEFNPEVNFSMNSVETGEDDEMEEDPIVGMEYEEEEE